MEDPILSGNSRYRDGWGQTMTALARRSDIRFYTSPQCKMKKPNLNQKIVWRDLYSKPWVGSLYAGDSGLPLGPFEVTAAK